MSYQTSTEGNNAPEFVPIDYISQDQLITIEEITREFDLKTERLIEISNHFMRELNKGLEKYGQTLAMVPSFVTGRPTGQETGTFLSLDLGGTNLRICQVDFQGNGVITIKQEKYLVSEAQKVGESHILFDFIANCVLKFLVEIGYQHEKEKEKVNLGFTFSFPVAQTAIDKGTLLKWTKGFVCPDAVGKDVVSMLQESLDRLSVPVKVVALVNDTVGTLLSHSYKYPNTLLGVILGTGTNSAFFERLSNIKKLNISSDATEEMIVNIEWGAFDDEKDVLPLTKYDEKLDLESHNPTYQIFEKMISGMYLGEIVRNTLLHLIDRSLLFNGISSPELNKHYIFETKYMTVIEVDTTPTLEDTRKILEETMNIPSVTLTDRQIVKRICRLVGRRAARLSSLGLAGVIKHCGAVEGGCGIGIDGSLFEFYPNFKENIRAALREILGDNVDNIEIQLAKDGSGVGS
ncbi:12490_t:CDS:2, partial [Acaulospora morrowiae]